MQKGGVDTDLVAQNAAINGVNYGPQDSLAKLQWSEARAAFARQANEIAKHIFNLHKEIVVQDIQETNLALLALFHRYLFEDSSRRPWATS